MVHIGAAAALLDHLDGLVGEAHRRIGQRQRQHALLRTRRPGDHARIVVDVEVGDAEARHRIDDAHHAVLHAGIGEALEVVDAARAGLPMGHERPHGLVLGERLVDGLAGDRLAVRRLDDDDARGFGLTESAASSSAVEAFMRMVRLVDAGEGAVGEGHDLVTRQDQAQHAVEAVEAGAGDADRCRRSWCPTARAASAWPRSCRGARPSACGRPRRTLAKRSSTRGSVFPGPGPAARVSGITSCGNTVMGTPSVYRSKIKIFAQSSTGPGGNEQVQRDEIHHWLIQQTALFRNRF